jgi:protein O-mannosyl-transferase
MSKAVRKLKNVAVHSLPGGEQASSSKPGWISHNSALVDLAVCVGLILAALFVYSQVTGFEFINFDDPDYVPANPHVQAGLTLAGIKYAFTSAVASNWIPVTLLSHMLDVQLFALDPGMHHFMSFL